MAWLTEHLPIVLSILLGLSEGLALAFPSTTGFGGVLAGVVKALKGLGAKAPGEQ